MAITNGYCTLAEFKSYKDIASTDAADDAVIENIIEGISRTFDGLVGRTFYARTETHYYDTPEEGVLVINDDDLLSVTTLTNGDGTVLTTDYYSLYPLNTSPKIRIQLKNGAVWYPNTYGYINGAISLVGSWGYSATVPDEIRESCIAESVAEYLRRFGENANTTTTVTPAGVVIVPQAFSKITMMRLNKYRRYV